MIDGVELNLLEHVHRIRELEDGPAILGEERLNSHDEIIDVRGMGKHVIP